MQVSSYTFKSPYPQAVQVGQPDPSSVKKEEQTQTPTLLENQKPVAGQGKVNPTLDSGVSISVSALQSGNSQSSVSEFKSLVSINQGQKAYSQEN
ncbi:hypothetical protein [Sulfuricurvum sp.]|uniref:hypothetical protein n=1 Tax=Sulfuricurvum sp. TaxID=2025608 RepID=UPI002E344FB9|nr:hypothetical protein [Sulfuricurvum sp.]HEX5328673.1 hypothetical protein [Sulfuricurvum sp.]